MSLLNSRMQWDARNVFGNAGGLAEPVIYTAKATGVTYPLNVVVERFQVAASQETGHKRTRTVKFLLPRDPTAVKTPASTELGDTVLLPWNVGDVPSRFTVVGNATQDAAAWEIRADKSI